MKDLETTINHFFTQILTDDNASEVLNHTFRTLADRQGVGIDLMVNCLHYQCIDREAFNNDVGLEHGWETADGKHHMAVIMVKNDDNQEHCFGEWLERAQGVIVLEPNRDNTDAIDKATAYLESQNYVVLDKDPQAIVNYLEGLDGKEYVCINHKDSDALTNAVELVRSLNGMAWHSGEDELEDLREDFFVFPKNNVSLDDQNDMVNFLERYDWVSFPCKEIQVMADHLELKGYLTICDDIDNVQDNIRKAKEYLETHHIQTFPQGWNYKSVENLFNFLGANPKIEKEILETEFHFEIDFPVSLGIESPIKAQTKQDAIETLNHRIAVKVSYLNELIDGHGIIDDTQIKVIWK